MADCDIFIYGEAEVSYLKKRDIVEQNWFAKKRGEIESNLIPLLPGGGELSYSVFFANHFCSTIKDLPRL